MPKALHKVQKLIAQKKGSTKILHGNSRDAQMLLRANARAVRMEKKSDQRRRLIDAHLIRVRHFKSVAAQADQSPLTMSEIHDEITRYIARNAQEQLSLQQVRRPSRPPSKRELDIRNCAAIEAAEYDSGFWVPDLRDAANLQALIDWNGEYVALNTVKFLRVMRNSNNILLSTFPPNGES